MTWLESSSFPPDRRAAGPRAGQVAIDVKFGRGTATVVISGELDLLTRALLSERLSMVVRRKPRRLVLDMARTSFMDCGSARLIAAAGQSLADAGQLVIRHPGPAVRRVLELTSLDAVCQIEA
jgi:anti-sigma B factor antagonist